MSDAKTSSDRPKASELYGKLYRVWSLTGQGFLTFTPTDGAKMEKNADSSGTGKENSNGAKMEKNADSSVTGKENSREIKAKRKLISSKRGFSLEFQEDEKTYLLQPNANYTSVSEKLSSDDNQDQPLFYFTDFGPFKALVTVETNGKKCLASNSAKKLSLMTYHQDTPHPDTLFLITEV